MRFSYNKERDLQADAARQSKARELASHSELRSSIYLRLLERDIRRQSVRKRGPSRHI